MKTSDLKTKYRILVVKDQSKYFQAALQNAVNLAKMIDGSIDLLYVKSPLQAASQENQLAALRELQKDSGTAKMTMKEVVDLIATREQIPVTYNFTFGNTINEVQQHINATRPDIVVLGKSKRKVKDLFRTDLTSYLLKNYQGAVLISKDEQVISSHDIALGVLDDFLVKGSSKLSEDLARCTAKPIIYLKINTSSNGQMEQTDVVDTDITTFEFDQGTNISNSVSKYIERSGISLLCVGKSKLPDLNKTIKKANTPVLVLAS